MNTIRISFVLMMLAFVASAPLSAEAATAKPTCSLEVTTADGDRERTKKSIAITAAEGDEIEIAWDSSRAKEATLNGDDIDLEGSKEFTVTKSTDYEFEFFSSASKKTTCTVEVNVLAGTIDSTLVSSNNKPTISGTASGASSLELLVVNDSGKTVFKKTVKVKKEKWSARVSKSLPSGVYDLELRTTKRDGRVLLTSETLTITGKNSSAVQSASTLTVANVPLLSGGNVSGGSSVPVAYIQVRNTGSKSTNLSGVWVTQKGTAATSAITMLEVRDDKGVTRGTATNTGSLFDKNGKALAPANVELLAGESRLFTVRATARAGASGSIVLEVTRLDTASKVSGSLPIPGVTWNII